MTQSPQAGGGSSLTLLGKLISFVLVVGLVGLGAWIVLKKKDKPADSSTPPAQNAGATSSAKVSFDASDLVETQTSVPRLTAPAAYVPQNNIVDVELSEYAGYAGFIVANG